MLKLASAMLALAVVAGGASAAEDLPAYTPGETFVFDDGRVEQVRETAGTEVTWATRSGRTYVRSANPATPILEWTYRGQEGARALVGDPNALFPLRPGASARFSAVTQVRPEEGGKSRRSVQLYACWVEAMETTETPAGAFEAYPIVCDRHSPHTMRTLERVTWRYAPDVGHYVGRERRSLRDGAVDEFRLFATIPPREANAVRIDAVAAAARAAKEAEDAAPKRKADTE